MFCPNCGAEYPQKINYCKRCGANMTAPTNTVEVHIPPPRFAGMFWAVAVMSIVGLIACFIAFNEFAHEGLRGDHLLVTFVAGLFFIGCVAGGLIWQLARLVSTFQQTVRQPKAETIPLLQSPPPSLATPPEPLASVSEHTTRSFDSAVYLEAERRKRRE
ncbi:MAG TPA: zinc ribbon domain-containing protein [Blastocatellia bacterium]|nr:zinc ribbon domain-containing protein [Blastocatellia bacterium]